MIISERIKIKDKDFMKTYSNKQVQIQKVGTEELYVEAIDPIEYEREYIETDIPIEEENEEI